MYMYLHFFHGGFTGWSPPSPSPSLWKFQFTAPACGFRLNREEKSLSHVVMVAKFLDDNKPRKSLKKYMRTVSNFIDLIQFHLICQMLAKCSGYFESERTISKFRKRKRRFCVVFTYSIKWVHETRGGGGARGYFLGGSVPPGTPNWHPGLKKLYAKIDTPV